MIPVSLGTMPPEGPGRWAWVRDAFNKITLASKRTDTTAAATSGTGDVVGPAGATANNPAVFNGATGKLIKEITYAAFKTALVLVKGDVGLGNVDNTTDAGKPVSTAQQTALDLKANIASPTFTGVPAAPTAAPGTNTTQLSTTAFVKAAIDVVLGGVGAAFDTLSEIATELALKAPIASPTFTGTVSGITKSMVGLGNVDNTADADKPVSTATQTALDLKADLASPALTGTPTAPTQDPDDNSTAIATTEYVDAAVEAGLDSPALTGSPTAPTLNISDDSDSIATTAFVHNLLDSQSHFDPWQMAKVPADSYQWGHV